MAVAEKQTPVFYNAAETYRREEMVRQVPGNTPASVMQRYKAGIMEALQNDTRSVVSGFSQRVANWSQYDLTRRVKECQDITDPQEIRVLLSMEPHNDVLSALLMRKRQIDPDPDKTAEE